MKVKSFMARRNKNRRVTKKMSVVAAGTWNIFAMMVFVVAAAIMNLIADARCEQEANIIGEKERKIKALEDAKVREAARWEELKTSDKLEERLYRNGMKMSYAQPQQIIRMNAAGKVIPGQRSVALAKQRSRSRSTAKLR